MRCGERERERGREGEEWKEGRIKMGYEKSGQAKDLRGREVGEGKEWDASGRGGEGEN